MLYLMSQVMIRKGCFSKVAKVLRELHKSAPADQNHVLEWAF